MTTLKQIAPVVEVEEVTTAEGHEIFERACRRHLGVGMDEFMEKFVSGEYPAEWSAQEIQEVEFLLPFVQEQ